MKNKTWAIIADILWMIFMVGWLVAIVLAWKGGNARYVAIFCGAACGMNVLHLRRKRKKE